MSEQSAGTEDDPFAWREPVDFAPIIAACESGDKTGRSISEWATMRDESDLALSILRKAIAGDSAGRSFVMVERYEKGGIDAILDTGRFGVTEEEAQMLQALIDEADA